MRFLIIADSFREDFLGGAELCVDALIQKLRRDHLIKTLHCNKVTETIAKEWDGAFIVSNFISLPDNIKDLLKDKQYFIFEHDSKFCRRRDLSAYPDFIVPPEDIINFDFYKNAYKVVLQTKRHHELTKLNLKLDNLVSCNGNLWYDSDLNFIEKLQDVPKNDKWAVLEHPFFQKNTAGAKEYAEKEGLDYEVIPQLPHRDYLNKLAEYKGLIFLPLVFETFSRVCAEAAMLNLEIIGNDNISFLKEEYTNLRGKELIEYFCANNDKIVEIFLS